MVGEMIPRPQAGGGDSRHLEPRGCWKQAQACFVNSRLMPYAALEFPSLCRNQNPLSLSFQDWGGDNREAASAHRGSLGRGKIVP